jgi:thiamine pyrophosphate-dependent acetolactate synthase large subunit-like protein
MNKSTHTGGEAVVETLAAAGVDTVFGIPGGHSLPIYAALYGHSQVRHVLGRHEQGLGYMADGYARASGRLAAVTTTSGPGVANIVAALAQATTDNVPMVVVSSAPSAALIGRNRGGLHDLNDAIELARPACRYVAHADAVDEISPKLADLIRNLRCNRPGGAFLQVPTNILGASADTAICSSDGHRLAPDMGTVAAAAELLQTATRPLIIAGYGALLAGAGPAIQALAERLDAVVATTTLARGLLGVQSWVVFDDGAIPSALTKIFAEADVTLAIGTMFRQEDTAGWQTTPAGRLIHIDIDADEFDRTYTADVSIHADARLAAEAIAAALPVSIPGAESTWRQHAAGLQHERLEARRDQPAMQFTEALREIIPQDTIVFADRCNVGYWMYRVAAAYEPRTFNYPMGYGGLGSALPQAIGARLACPERRILSIIGDGGMQFTLPELAVAVQEQTPFTLLISNNGAYGAIQAGLDRNFDGVDPSFGTALSGPDYGLIAKAYGIGYARVDSEAELLRVLPDQLQNDQLNIVEFRNAIPDP